MVDRGTQNTVPSMKSAFPAYFVTVLPLEVDPHQDSNSTNARSDITYRLFH